MFVICVNFDIFIYSDIVKKLKIKNGLPLFPRFTINSELLNILIYIRDMIYPLGQNTCILSCNTITLHTVEPI